MQKLFTILLMKSKLLLFFSLSLFVGCTHYEPKAEELECDSIPVDFALASARTVVYNDSVFIFFGRNSGGLSKKYYVADIDNLSEFKEYDLPINPRVSAIAARLGNKVFMGLGTTSRQNSSLKYYYDWWSYNLDTHELDSLAPFPGVDPNAAVSWVDEQNNIVYVAFGYIYSPGGCFHQNVYAYFVEENRWELICDEGNKKRTLAAAGVVNGRFFAGCGFNTFNLKDWWEFIPDEKKWIKRADTPSKGRIFSATAVNDNLLYLVGGRYWGGTETSMYLYKDILVYDADADTWLSLGNMPTGGTENLVSFFAKGKLFWGLGQTSDGKYVKTFYYTVPK